MKKFSFYAALLGILISGFTSAQENETLRQVREKFNSASTITANISQTSGNNTIDGKIFIKKDNMLRLEFRNITIISNGETIWNFNKKENKVIINEFNENDPSAFSFNKILNEYPQKSNVTSAVEGENNILIIKPGNSSELNFDSVRLQVNSDYLIERIRIEKSGNPLEIAVSNYKFNQNIPDSQFSFTPPQGTQVIDLR